MHRPATPLPPAVTAHDYCGAAGYGYFELHTCGTNTERAHDDLVAIIDAADLIHGHRGHQGLTAIQVLSQQAVQQCCGVRQFSIRVQPRLGREVVTEARIRGSST